MRHLMDGDHGHPRRRFVDAEAVEQHLFLALAFSRSSMKSTNSATQWSRQATTLPLGERLSILQGAQCRGCERGGGSPGIAGLEVVLPWW